MIRPIRAHQSSSRGNHLSEVIGPTHSSGRNHMRNHMRNQPWFVIGLTHSSGRSPHTSQAARAIAGWGLSG